MSIQRNRRRLAGSIVSNETFENQDLRGGIAVGASFTNCTFRNCKMGRVRFSGASFSGCHFEGCDFGQALLDCQITDSFFWDCDLDEALFHSAIIVRTIFERCRLEYAVFTRATMLGGGVVDCQLHGAVLDFAETDRVDFSRSNLWGVVMSLSCAGIVDNTFDHRQLHMLLAIVSRANLEPSDREKIMSILDPKVLKLVERLIGREESSGPEKNDDDQA